MSRVNPLNPWICLHCGISSVSQLARLGVTNLALVRDEQTAGVVLEGWLFDPLGSAPAVTNVIGTEHATRLLHPVMHLAISANTKEAQIAHQRSYERCRTGGC